MKKYVLLCLMSALSFGATANDYENYKLDVSGEVETVIKSEDNVTTPFDYVDWGWSTRGGASDRDSQFAKVQGNVNFSSGTLGMSEYFGMLSLNVDPQATNDVVELRNGQLGETTWVQSEKNKIEVTNAFAMWRPWAVKDKDGNIIGRPFGITVGNQSIPATVNALNENIFKGDIDGDFVGYSNTALLNKPGVHLDFHTGKFGLGYAYLKGSSDLLNNSAGYTNERSKTQVGYVDANVAGFDFNGAYQYSQGNRKTVDTLTQVQNYFGNSPVVDSVSNDDYGYSGTSINACLGYNIKLGENSKIKPFVGYQKTDTDVAPDIIVETANQKYGSNFNIQRVEAQFTTVGAKYETKLFGKKVKVSGEYSKCDTPDSKGLDLVYDGQIDYDVQALLNSDLYQEGLAQYDAGVVALYGPGTAYAVTAYGTKTYDMTNAAFKGISGNGNTTYTLAGLEAMGQVDMTVEMNKNFDITLFYKLAKAKDVDYKVTTEQVAKIKAGFEAIGYDSNISGVLAQNLADGIESGIKTSTKWSDYNSVGVSAVFRF